MSGQSWARNLKSEQAAALQYSWMLTFLSLCINSSENKCFMDPHRKVYSFNHVPSKEHCFFFLKKKTSAPCQVPPTFFVFLYILRAPAYNEYSLLNRSNRILRSVRPSKDKKKKRMVDQGVKSKG